MMLALVENKVGVAPLLRAHLHHSLACVAVFASKALVFQFGNIKVTNDVVVELVPLFPILALAVTNE